MKEIINKNEINTFIITGKLHGRYVVDEKNIAAVSFKAIKEVDINMVDTIPHILIFENCDFYEPVLLHHIPGPKITFINCTFHSTVDLIFRFNDIKFEKCTILNIMNLNLNTNLNCEILNCTITNQLTITGNTTTTFKLKDGSTTLPIIFTQYNTSGIHEVDNLVTSKIIYKNCHLTKAEFKNLSLESIDFNVIASDQKIIFSDSTIKDTNITNCNFIQNLNFNNATITGLFDFSGSLIKEIEFETGFCKKFEYSFKETVQLKFKNAKFHTLAFKETINQDSILKVTKGNYKV